MKTTKEKNMVKAGRLNEAYRYLYAQQSVTSQTDFAEKIGVRGTSLSFAMNGNPAYLTNNLFIKVCAAFPNVFNRDYLLTGEGTLLSAEEEDIMRNITGNIPSQVEKPVGAIIELYAQLIKEVESIRADLKEELVTTRQLTAELRTTLRELRDESDRHYAMAAEN